MAGRSIESGYRAQHKEVVMFASLFAWFALMLRLMGIPFFG